MGAAVVLVSQSKLERIRVVPGGDKHSVQVLLSPSALQNTSQEPDDPEAHHACVMLWFQTEMSSTNS